MGLGSGPSLLEWAIAGHGILTPEMPRTWWFV